MSASVDLAPTDTGPTLPEVASWAAIHTQPRAEKVVAAWLEMQKIPHYLPAVRSRRVYGARERISWLPLFPGYLFHDAAAPSRLVYASKKVARILRPDDPALLRADLENLAGLLAKKPDLQRARITEPGTPVEIVSGPYRGTHGEFVRRKGRTLLVLRVHFIGFGAILDVDESRVRPLDPEEGS